MPPIKVMSIFGTRPEAIKMLPLVCKFREQEDFQSFVCVTAQHREMLDQVLHAFNIEPDFDLNLMLPRQTLTDITANVIIDMKDVFEEKRPDIVLVHGDTTTSFAGALAAFYEKIPVGHVEAGLRTGNKYSPFPEEMNRNLTSKLADLHFAPTQLNAENLRKEGIVEGVHVTGNTVIDALFSIVREDYVFKNPVLNELDYKKKKTILLTCHRRENLGAPMKEIFSAVRTLADRNRDCQIIYPVHKNPIVQSLANEELANHPRIILMDPLQVEDMHNLFAHCYMVMTDSGGIQEEAPAFGKPVLVMREETERPEAVESGITKVIGTNRMNILYEASRLLTDPTAYEKMATAQNPYGDGHASERICSVILDYFKDKERGDIDW